METPPDISKQKKKQDGESERVIFSLQPLRKYMNETSTSAGGQCCSSLPIVFFFARATEAVSKKHSRCK